MKWKLQNEPKFFGFTRVIPAQAGIQISVNLGIVDFLSLCSLRCSVAKNIFTKRTQMDA